MLNQTIAYAILATAVSTATVSAQSSTDATAKKTLVRPPAGRLAIVADGNSPDPDDIGATAVIFGLLKASGLNDRLVHLSHSCDLKPTKRISAKDELRRQKVMHEVCTDGVTRFGPCKNLKSVFNCRTDQQAAVNDLRDAINASSKTDPLWIIEAGEPDIIGYALDAANSSKHKYVHVVSHHPANDNAGDFYLWKQILNFGITEHQIGDQNVGLQTAISPWDWAKSHRDPDMQWIHGQLAYAEQDGVVKFQTNKFDCSDAGMVYWWITGANKGGNRHADPTHFKSMLLQEESKLGKTLATINDRFEKIEVELLEWPAELQQRLGKLKNIAFVAKPTKMPAGRIPLLISLHGGGGKEMSIADQLERSARVKGLRLAELAGKNLILLEPNSADSWDANSLNEMLDYMLKTRPEIDDKRVYVMGHSMGGAGTWDWINESPQRFAAAAPAGFSPGDTGDPTRLVKLPIWGMVGGQDGDRVTGIRKMVETLRAAGNPNVKHTEFKGANHSRGNAAVFSSVELVDWMLGFSR